MIYRVLRDMEEKAWVTSTWDEEETQGPARRIYRLTTPGDEVLAAWVQDLEEARRRIDHLWSAYRRHMEEAEGEHNCDSAEEPAG